MITIFFTRLFLRKNSYIHTFWFTFLCNRNVQRIYIIQITYKQLMYILCRSIKILFVVVKLTCIVKRIKAKSTDLKDYKFCFNKKSVKDIYFCLIINFRPFSWNTLIFLTNFMNNNWGKKRIAWIWTRITLKKCVIAKTLV